MRRFVPRLWNRFFGDRGERAAARFLRREGLRILTRGYDTLWGEIDLIAREGDILVFVEVKTRRRGTPAEAVTPEKQRRLTLAALHFLRRRNLLEQRSALRCGGHRVGGGPTSSRNRAHSRGVRGGWDRTDVSLRFWGVFAAGRRSCLRESGIRSWGGSKPRAGVLFAPRDPAGPTHPFPQ